MLNLFTAWFHCSVNVVETWDVKFLIFSVSNACNDKVNYNSYNIWCNNFFLHIPKVISDHFPFFWELLEIWINGVYPKLCSVEIRDAPLSKLLSRAYFTICKCYHGTSKQKETSNLSDRFRNVHSNEKDKCMVKSLITFNLNDKRKIKVLTNHFYNFIDRVEISINSHDS